MKFQHILIGKCVGILPFQKTIAELGNSFAEVATSADRLAIIMSEVNKV